MKPLALTPIALVLLSGCEAFVPIGAGALPAGSDCAADSDCASRFCREGSCASGWPSGEDGDLDVPENAVFRIPNGVTRDYRRVRVARGGSIEIGEGERWTVMGVREELVLDGVLRAQSGTSCGGVIETRAPARDGSPTGEALRHEIEQGAGGAGGKGGGGLRVDCDPEGASPEARFEGGIGGATGCGSGGGGGSGASSIATLEEEGRRPASDGSATGGGNGGAGAGYMKLGGGASGGRGEDGAREAHHFDLGGGGGGGGARGLHGQPIYLDIGRLAGAGAIIAAGRPGGDGGHGVDGGFRFAPCFGSSGGSGGGGGGAGGSGGRVVIRLRHRQDHSIRIDVAGGEPGVGGRAGGTGGGIGMAADASHRGRPGEDGRIDVREIQ